MAEVSIASWPVKPVFESPQKAIVGLRVLSTDVELLTERKGNQALLEQPEAL